MMKKEIDLSDAIGKTLEGFKFSTTIGQMVMVSSDETFAEEIEKRKKEIKDKREKFEMAEFKRLRKKFVKNGIML